jgi:hypothetical protein
VRYSHHIKVSWELVRILTTSVIWHNFAAHRVLDHRDPSVCTWVKYLWWYQAMVLCPFPGTQHIRYKHLPGSSDNGMCGHALRIQLHTTFVRITSECTYVRISTYPPLCVTWGWHVYALHIYIPTYPPVCVTWGCLLTAPQCSCEVFVWSLITPWYHACHGVKVRSPAWCVAEYRTKRT